MKQKYEAQNLCIVSQTVLTGICDIGEDDIVCFCTGGAGLKLKLKHIGTMMLKAIKIVDLNPNVPEDQIYDLICEKFSNFSDFTVEIVQHDKNRVAYLSFKNDDDARTALRENSCVVLFGYACRALPVYDKRGSRGPAVSEPSSRDYSAADDDTFRKSGVDHEQADLSPEERSPARPADRGSFRSASSVSRGGRWQRGSSSLRTRETRGKPYLLTAPRLRTGQKPYLLTKPRDNGEQKQLPAARSDDDETPPETTTVDWATSDETVQREMNSILYIGAMDPKVQMIDLQRLFNNFGFVLHVEIKKPSSQLCFAFVHFLTMDMACLAKQEMEGKPVGRTIPKLGFGRVVESKSLWVGGLGPWTTEDMLHMEFGQFGEIAKVIWPKNRDYAYILFTSMQDATDAKQVMHNSLHGEPPHRLRVCYANHVQVNSNLNHKPEFPKFPKRPRPEGQPKKRIVSRSVKTDFPEKRKSRDWESQESHRRRGRSSERSRRRSSERSRSRSHPRKSRSHGRSRKKERTPPSPYARSISQASSNNDMSAISETSSESTGSLERNRQRKSRRKSLMSRSPVNKPLRNPSPPPKPVMKDERTVVLRSEPLPATGVSGAPSNVFTSAFDQMHTAAVPAYVSPVDPVTGMYYPPVAGTLPPTVFPPPVHIPPPDFYMPSNPVMVQYPQHLPPLASYPPVATDNTQPLPAVSHSSVPAAQTSRYSPGKLADKLQPDAKPVQEVKKSASSSVAAKFPKVWSGALVLRNAAFVVDFHLLSGSVVLVNRLLGGNVEPGAEADCPVLKIAQRLRLDQPDKLDELDRRLKKAGRTGCSVLLATSTPAQVDDDANVVQQYPLSSLVSYLLQKQVAAVVSLPPGTSDAAKATGVLHAFPTCQFAVDFLRREAPGLPANCPTEEELLVVLC